MGLLYVDCFQTARFQYPAIGRYMIEDQSPCVLRDVGFHCLPYSRGYRRSYAARVQSHVELHQQLDRVRRSEQVAAGLDLRTVQPALPGFRVRRLPACTSRRREYEEDGRSRGCNDSRAYGRFWIRDPLLPRRFHRCANDNHWSRAHRIGWPELGCLYVQHAPRRILVSGRAVEQGGGDLFIDKRWIRVRHRRSYSRHGRQPRPDRRAHGAHDDWGIHAMAICDGADLFRGFSNSAASQIAERMDIREWDTAHPAPPR